ncbi:MAG: ABC transporter substrate-binding protein [Butyricicoccus sp.]
MKKNGILFRVASGLLAAALTLSLTACGGSSSNSDASATADSADSGATHLRLIYSPSLCAAPMYIAIENGYFEDEGLDIEQVTVDAAHVSEAIGANQVDVGMVPDRQNAPAARERLCPIKFTTGIHTSAAPSCSYPVAAISRALPTSRARRSAYPVWLTRPPLSPSAR